MSSEKRIAILLKFIEDEPQNPFNKYALAMEYYEGESGKSKVLLDELLSDFPDYLPPYYKTAHLYWGDDDLDKAAEIFRKGIELAKKQQDNKALGELKAAYLNLQFEMD